MGWAFSVFGWAYAFFEIPGGWLGDRMGARRVLMRIVIWWSFFTAATGWVWNTTSLIVTRTLFGAGEAGAFPNMTRIFTTWLPGRERERAQAILWLSSRWGGALTPLLVALHPAVHVLAPRVRAVRRPRRDLGGGVLPVVPRRSRRAPLGEQGGARDAAADRTRPPPSQAGSRGGCSYRSLPSGCSARSTSASATAGGST